MALCGGLFLVGKWFGLFGMVVLGGWRGLDRSCGLFRSLGFTQAFGRAERRFAAGFLWHG
jgi:hypothetical protein